MFPGILSSATDNVTLVLSEVSPAGRYSTFAIPDMMGSALMTMVSGSALMTMVSVSGDAEGDVFYAPTFNVQSFNQFGQK